MDIRKLLENIMKNYIESRTREKFNSESPMYKLVVNDSIEIIKECVSKFNNINIDINFKASCGTGGWTNYPWIAVFNPDITTTIQEGVYIVYLFSEDMKRVYLTLNQGYTNLKKQLGTKKSSLEMTKRRHDIRSKINNYKFITDNELKIGKTEYEQGCIFYKEYKLDNLPANEELVEDLNEMINIYKTYYFEFIKKGYNETIQENDNKYQNKDVIEYIAKYIKANGFEYKEEQLSNLYLSLKTKPFVILSGISGTGKSKLAKLFAQALGSTSENRRFTLIPVRPDWSDAAELIGYRDLNGVFHPGLLTSVIEKAISDKPHPYFVCLDEMNLARVEYYLSDILSIIESKYLHKNGEIKTDKLIREELLGSDKEALDKYKGLYIPENLYIIGTVNMDETTFPFSKKVLDRANTIEFNEVNLEFNFDSFEQEKVEGKEFTNAFLKSKYINLIDCKDDKELATDIIKELVKINKILEKYNQHFAYRVRDEIVYYCLYALKDGLLTKEQALDYCIVQKILPKICGSDDDTAELLKDLYNYLNNEAKYTVSDFENNKVEQHGLYKLSNKKIVTMIRRFVRNGFTNFWE